MSLESLIAEVATTAKITLLCADVLVRDWLGFSDMDESEQEEVEQNVVEYREYILGKAELYEPKIEEQSKVSTLEELLEERNVILREKQAGKKNTDKELTTVAEQIETVRNTFTPSAEEALELISADQLDKTEATPKRESSSDLLVAIMKTDTGKGFTIAELTVLFEASVTDRELSVARFRGIIKALLEQDKVVIVNPEESKNKRYSLRVLEEQTMLIQQA